MAPKALTLVTLGRLAETEARTLLESIRWPHGPVCAHCGGAYVTRLNGAAARPGTFQCNAGACRGQFTVTLGTIFEDSHIPLHKWVLAFALMCSSKKGISALQLKRNLDLGSYKTAWFMAHRIRYAMAHGPLKPPLLTGTVEVDETYVGGVAPGKRGRGAAKKVIMLALVERDGRIKAKPVETISAKELKGAIREYVGREARIMTDDLASYQGLKREFADHKIVKHSAGEYVRGDAHVNTAESFFALFKRGVHGTFHHISKRHLSRYADEFSFRWDHRKVDDGERTLAAIARADGKRLMYRGRNDTLTA